MKTPWESNKHRFFLYFCRNYHNFFFQCSTNTKTKTPNPQTSPKIEQKPYFVGFYWNLMAHHWNLLTFIDIYWHLLEFLPPNSNRFQQMSSHSTKFQQIPTDSTTFQHIPPHSNTFHPFPPSSNIVFYTVSLSFSGRLLALFF